MLQSFFLCKVVTKLAGMDEDTELLYSTRETQARWKLFTQISFNESFHSRLELPLRHQQIEIATRWLFSNKRLPPTTLMLRRRGLELRMPSVLLEWVAHWLLIFAKSLLRVSSLQICLDFLCLIGKTEREHGEYVWGWWCCLLGEEGGQVKHF